LYEGLVNTYLNGLVGRPLTDFFIHRGITPNTVTALSAATGVLSAFLISFPDYLLGVIAAVLFQGAAILDCCDGDVARRTGTQTDWGRTLDLVSDYVCYATMFSAIGSGMDSIVASLRRSPAGLTMRNMPRLKRIRTRSDAHSKIVNGLAIRDFPFSFFS
jgi:hypothetical protein